MTTRIEFAAQKRRLNVRFDTVQIIEFPIIFSINPSCSDDGPAIGLAWQPSVDLPKSPIVDIDTFEEIRIPMRRKDATDLRLTKSQRVSLLKEHGALCPPTRKSRQSHQRNDEEFEELSGVSRRRYKGKIESPMKRCKQRVRRRHSIRYETFSPPKKSPEELKQAMKDIQEKTDALTIKINQLGGTAA